MANDEADPWASRILDQYLNPSWRADAHECGEFWRKTFQTPSDRTIEAMKQTAYRKWLGRGGRT